MKNTSTKKQVKVVNDIHADNPLFFSDVVRVVAFHNKYNLGNVHDYNQEDYNSWEEVKKAILANEKVVSIKPLYMYEHSSFAFSTSPFSCPFDSGQVGFIYVVLDNYTKEMSEETTQNLIQSTIEDYESYSNGDVYLVEDENGEILFDIYGYSNIEKVLESENLEMVGKVQL